MTPKILLLDDDPRFRAFVRALLLARGWQVVEAADGREGTALLASARPDLVVVDGLLPDTDGVTWISRLRAAGSTVKVVFASAFWREGRSWDRLTKDLGVSLVLHKPIVPSALVAHLERELGVGPPGPGVDPAQALCSLAADYARSLPGKLLEVTDAVARARLDASALSEAILAAHRLRGTAGSYGFDEVGRAAGRLEDALAPLKDGPGGDEPWRPALEESRRLAALLPAPPADEGFETAGLRPAERLLVVDDDAEFLGLVRRLARPYMLDVVEGATRDLAMAEVVRQVPDAALLGVAAGSGERSFELARQLRALPGADGLPIAFVSADQGFDARVAAAHAGACLYVEKPLDEAAFGSALQQLLASRPVCPRVLIVDPDAEFRDRTEAVLARAGMQAVTATDPREILETLEIVRPDVVLLEVDLPGVSGFDVCRLLRTSHLWRDLPVLFAGSSGAVASRVAAFEAGADDHLVKPVDAAELVARIRVRIDRLRLMRTRAENDALTGVSTRRAFVEDFSVRLAEARRHEQLLSVALIDLDRFKAVNDEHGHLAGDRVLATFGKLLTSRFRAADLRGRWGGEEFALAFPETSPETAHAVVERLLLEFRANRFDGDEGGAFAVTFSAGVASFPADGSTLQELAKAADRRLYAAKKAGRARVCATD